MPLRFNTDPIQGLARQGIDLNQPASSAAGVDAPSGDPVPGTGQPSTTPSQAEPPAGAQNAETTQPSGGPPESVPYSRFKEVNDQLREFKQLEELGYDADSLRQLVNWGVQFDQNPADSWLAVAKELEDLPQDVRDVVETHLGVQQQETQPQQSDEDSEPPPWAQELKQRLDDRDAEDERAARATILNDLVAQWKKADQKDGLTSISDDKIYTYISANAPKAKSEQELFDLARREYMETREFVLNGSVVKREDRGAPVTVPGSGSPVTEAPPKPRTLAEASQQAIADAQAGNLNTDGVRRT